MKKSIWRISVVLAVTSCLLFVFAFGCADIENNGDDENVETTYTLTFVTGVDSIGFEPIVAAAGEPITLPTELSRDGYRFDGWKDGDVFFTSSVMPAKDITLTAAWTKYYTVIFVTGVDSLDFEPITATAGEPITLPTDLSRDGYRFGGWKDGGALFTSNVMPEKDVTLTAVWTKLYTVTFNSGVSGLVVPEAQYAAGEAVMKPTAERAGYVVLKWLLDGEPFDFSSMPDYDVTLTAEWLAVTNLPAVVIDLYDEHGNTLPLYSVTREAYVDSVITVTNTEEKFELDSLKASFKGRGNDTWNYDKKGYKIKFDKKQSVFGREKNKHWVLIACVQFEETTMSRNYLAYNMANEVFDGIEYSTPAYWVDLTVNGEYRGVYVLCEHVRVGEGRVDIESEYGVEDTGYLIEYDALATGEEGVDYFRVDGVKYPFTVHSPDPEDRAYETDGGITKEQFKRQVAYIKDYVTRVYRAALNRDYETFCALADIDSFLDMYILHELFKNVDTGWGSFYMYKKPNGKLYAGPAWDFDGTANGASWRGDRSPQGIYVARENSNGDGTEPALYISLYQTSGFQADLRARWKVLSPKIRVFLDQRLNDTVYETNKAAMGKNYVFWNNKNQEAAERDWVNDTKTLKQWLIDRIAWLDTEWV